MSNTQNNLSKIKQQFLLDQIIEDAIKSKLMPSTITDQRWISQNSDNYLSVISNNNFNVKYVGKWLIYCKPDDIDNTWHTIRKLTKQNKLGIQSKVSTAKSIISGEYDEHVICVYTVDFKETVDVWRVRNELHKANITQPLRYKADIATISGIEEYEYDETV